MNTNTNSNKNTTSLTISERIALLDRERERLQAVEQVLSAVEDNIRWCMDFKMNEDGNWAYDENGEHVRVVPDEDSYNYAKYNVWCELRDYLLK